MLALEKQIKDEVEFWRWFIAEREKKGGGCVPPRAREALAYAEQKLASYRNESFREEI